MNFTQNHLVFLATESKADAKQFAKIAFRNLRPLYFSIQRHIKRKVFPSNYFK